VLEDLLQLFRPSGDFSLAVGDRFSCDSPLSVTHALLAGRLSHSSLTAILHLTYSTRR